MAVSVRTEDRGMGEYSPGKGFHTPINTPECGVSMAFPGLVRTVRFA